MMFYTTEEAAIVCGFLNLYLDRASVDASVRERNAAFQCCGGNAAASGLPMGGESSPLSKALLVAVA